MRLKRDFARLAVWGSTAGSWMSGDDRWIFTRSPQNGLWFIVARRHGGLDDGPDEIFLAKHGLSDGFPTRRAAVTALQLALA